MTAGETAEVLKVPELTPGARRIVEVAAELFYRRGIHAVGVDTIARESGITKRTLYDRFGSKDALVAVYLQARHQRWWERLERRIAGAPWPRALAVFDAYADDEWSSERGCAFLNAAGELPAEHPAYRVVRAHKRAVRDRLAGLVRADCPDAENPEALTEHLFLLLEGAIAHRGLDGDATSLASARGLAEHLLQRPTT
ncbi:TetR/AcrR family transcriptional regulator [Rothia sp. AR01]|uniref:TetR/AcrR family transcriptional regulator n=1 Tax=Rothia santali TaxID=2949643 RepID=A0A9X2KKZ9_9MICC|nr:TetR/AcrR family transcriptional regulator [Rothia santali]MCP3425591.1 TetR/AcrR family transcriptional regulator [Rothia santali]